MINNKHNLTWSFSRHKTFSTCKRMYYYNYYGSLGGWDDNADTEVKKLYMLKKMTSLPILAGTLVHDEVEKVLNAVRNEDKYSQKDSEDNVIKAFKESWKQSKNKDWKKNVKHNTNLFEHYYNKEVSDDRLFEIKDIMINSIKGFYDSDTFSFIKTVAAQDWLAIEELDSFEIEGTKIWVKLDFATQHDGKVYIYDWKTGKEVKEHENQLEVYTLYAMEKWKLDLKQVRLFGIYLTKSIPEKKVKPTVDSINNVKHTIQQSIKEMKLLVNDFSESEVSLANFPKVNDAIENSWPCSICNFKEVCFSI